MKHLEQLIAIVQKYLPDDVSTSSITPNSRFIEELNINSAHLVDIVLDVEDVFDIMFENEDIEGMKTVKDALAIIESKIDTK